MIQKFLDLNFIQIKEDENLAKLRKSGEELVKKLSKNKAKIIPYTLIALDPEVKANNFDLNETKEIIINNWNTFVANSGDTPVTIIRAVILEALETMSKEIEYACIIWLSGRNVIKYFKLGRENDLLTKFLLDLGNIIEKTAIEQWSLLSESNSDKINNKSNELTSITVDKNTLQKHLEDASGPSNKNAKPNYDSPNPNWANAGQPWSLEFAPRAANGIATVLNTTFKKQTEAFKNQIEFLQKDRRAYIRTQLLWWKEACYSESLNKSYRELTDGLLQVTLAKDYSSFVPFIYPTSVDYFLKETHRALTSEESKRLKISEILILIQTTAEELKPIFIEQELEEGRIPLINFVIGLVWNKLEVTHFKNLTGISTSTEITLEEFTLWLFHNLQSLKIVKSK